MTPTRFQVIAGCLLLSAWGCAALASWVPRAADWRVELLAEDDHGLDLRVSLLPAAREELVRHGILPDPDPDAPPLMLGDWIALPPAADPVAEVLAQRWTNEGDGPALPCWSLSSPVLWMGMRFSSLDIDPVHAGGGGVLLEELILHVRFDATNPVNPGRADQTHSRRQLERAGGLAINAALLERVQAVRTGEEPLARYLVVGKNASLSYLQDWADWRRRQGCEVALVSSESLGVSGNNWEPIRNAAQAMLNGVGLDYLLLVGDMNLNQNEYHLPGDLVPGGPYAETNWGQRIVSDHSLTLLEGDDYFSDVVVGRFPADNASQLAIMANRALLYDQDPLVAGEDWLRKALVVYDVSGAGSRRETSLAIRQHLVETGISPVDTIRNNRNSNPQSPTLVTNAINDGRAVVNYRGFGYRYAWNGPAFGVNQINQLANFGRWPLVTSIVCGGGDFASANYDPCLGEAFLRAGSTMEPRGAIAFIGPSEEDTHSKWNNALDMAIYQGMLREGIRDVGGLLERGKAELWHCFPNDRAGIWYDPGSSSQANNVRFYYYCYNLLGDPGTRVRMGEQRTALAPDWTPPAVGSTRLDLSFTDENGAPGADLWVCLTGATTGRLALGRTDAAGQVSLNHAPLMIEDCHLVAHGDDWVPLVIDFTPETAESNIVLESWGVAVEDTLLSAGDDFRLELTLRQRGVTGNPAGYLLQVDALDEWLEVLQPTLELPDMAPGAVLSLEGLELRVAPSVEHGQSLPMQLSLLDQDGTRVWRQRVNAVAVGAHPEMELLDMTPALPAPGDEVLVHIGLRNTGPLPLDADSCRLYPMSTACAMLVQDGLFVTLGPGESGEAGPFRVRLADGVPRGSLLGMELVFFRADQSTAARLPLTLQVGEVRLTDPVGPDDHGYLIYHHNDEGAAAPTYSYTDVSTLGTEIPFNDEGVAFNEEGIDGSSKVVPLPFPFRFYGQDYDTITVCSNGWIAMGAQPDHFLGLNTPIPAAQGPNAMVAVFWTDLYNYYGSQRFGHCYRYHDPADHTFIIQWNNFQHTGHPYQDNWFQAILRDPAYWPTPTGDGEILLQYQDLVTTFGDLIFTVGIERPDQMAGLQYTFNGQYSAAGQPVTSQSALLITTAERFQETAVEPSTRPGSLDIISATPNPFNPETVLTVDLPLAAPLRLSVYNLRGELVRRLYDGPAAAGRRHFRFDAHGLAGGVYLVEVRQAGRLSVERVLYLP